MIPEDSRFLVLCLVLAAAGRCQGAYRRWTSNTNFDNAANWNVQRAPCGNDRVVIVDDGVLVYLQSNTSIQELVLPLNGEVLLGNDATLAFTNSPDTSGACPPAGGDVTFEVTAPQQWVDPRNWCQTQTEGGECQPPALLHSEQLPCVTDDVIFPRDSGFYVTLGSGMDFSLKSLKVSGSTFTTDSWRSYVASEDGRRMFPPAQNPSTLAITRSRCDDKSGCACGNDQGEVFRQLCSITSKNCERARCNSPVTAVGSCCPLCGGILNATAGRGFDFNDFQSLINSRFPPPNDTQVAISKTSAGMIQLVATDRTGGTSSQHAHNIYSSITADIQAGGHEYALDSVQLQVSSASVLPPSVAPHTGENMTSGEKTGIAFGVIIAIAVLVLAALIFVRMRRGKRPFPIDLEDIRGSLPNLPNLPSWPASLSRSARPAAAVRPSTRDNFEMSEDGFTNPMYGEGGFQTDVQMMELTHSDETAGFDNPLYSTVGKKFFSDPTQTDSKAVENIGADSNTESTS